MLRRRTLRLGHRRKNLCRFHHTDREWRMTIHQLLPCLRHGDAIGNHTIEIQRILRKWGHDSRIFADDIHDDMRAFAKSYHRLKRRHLRDALLIYHFSVGSGLSEYVRALPNPTILIYHNITPPDFLKGYDEYIRQVLEKGRHELKLFISHCDLALGDSEFNRLELEEMGFQQTGVLPIILNFDKYSLAPDQTVLNRYQDGWRNIIFVGRLVPNKCQEDIIHAFYLYKTYINPKSRLFLIGLGGIERYDLMLEQFLRRLQLDDVYFTGKVTDNELAAYYAIADLLVCMSEHEGFSVPLVEAMHANIPILAYNAASIPYTLDGAGVLINHKRYEEIAEMMDLLIEDQTVRAQILRAQQRRLEYFQKPKLERILQTSIDHVIGTGRQA
ncbi:glycosyltransferase [candidate division KSB3 bacterium]|uniref:Glycosyltransferase n=1 Tax=candidate division KSB3 bacterium TaxID=2044937 RepID=A0A9D5JZZ5_9BACT|nr:glycosyltransferase [candidate division KSB3 bacterium]MBD3327364.1 glycosyltransferase [candidate division KSB3 bacterium]